MGTPLPGRLAVFTEHGWEQFGRILRLTITGALLLATVGNALFAWAQPYHRWDMAHWLDVIHAVALILMAIGLTIGIVVLVRNRPLSQGLARLVPIFWALSTFVWMSTVVWTAITPHISTAATIGDTCKVAAIAIVTTMAWRVSVRDVRLVVGVRVV